VTTTKQEGLLAEARAIYAQDPERALALRRQVAESGEVTPAWSHAHHTSHACSTWWPNAGRQATLVATITPSQTAADTLVATITPSQTAADSSTSPARSSTTPAS